MHITMVTKTKNSKDSKQNRKNFLKMNKIKKHQKEIKIAIDLERMIIIDFIIYILKYFEIK